MKLSEFPRVRLAHLPTPLEPLPRLSDHLRGPRIYIKRDDQTGLALGGNKVRKLEFLAADALAQGADTLVTTGGPQSNHARQTAAAAAKLGLGCHLLLPKIVPISTNQYEASGNVLLDELFGATIEMPPADQFSPAALDDVVKKLTAAGKKPYRIPVGGSTAIGALGYVVGAHELVEQAEQQEIKLDAIVVPTGSAGTHGGIVAGMVHAGHAAHVQGFAVSGTRADKAALVHSLATEVLGMLDTPTAGLEARVHVDDAFVGPGYGLPTDGMLEAVRLVARLEGLLIDPVYTGKAMAGLIDAIRQGRFVAGQNVVFWHTGGTPALFAYQSTLANTSH